MCDGDQPLQFPFLEWRGILIDSDGTHGQSLAGYMMSAEDVCFLSMVIGINDETQKDETVCRCF